MQDLTELLTSIVREIGYDPKHVDRVSFTCTASGVDIEIKRVFWDVEKDAPVFHKAPHPVTGKGDGMYLITTDTWSFDRRTKTYSLKED